MKLSKAFGIALLEILFVLVVMGITIWFIQFKVWAGFLAFGVMYVGLETYSHYKHGR